ncbi:MAG: hypothetical protein K8W52_15985, partial [Deltaproteobacteria bacterium]|nr:hypothetical protein [Deltaproteobacteria bacterium]
AIPARPEVRPAAPPSRPGDDDGKKTAQTVIPPRARAKPAAPREPEPAPAPARPTPSSTPSKEEAFATVAPPTLY